MNYARILRVTNGLLILCGYQVHSFNSKSRRYRLSLWAIGNFVFMSAFYLIAFTHHFEHSTLLQLLKDVSPFLKRLVRVQVLLGLKIFLFGIYETHIVIRAANQFVSTLPEVFTKKFCREEAYAYFLNFSTLFISLAIVLYIAYEMDFELPPLDDILVFCGMFIPHFMLGGALRLYNIGIWLQREQLMELHSEFERIVPVETEQHADKALTMLECGNKAAIASGGVTNSDMSTRENSNQALNLSLQPLHNQLLQLTKTAAIFNRALKRQLLLLGLLNSNCLLAGTYSRVYYESTWYVLFLAHLKNVFQATNCGIFILIFWDYFTACLTQLLLGNVRQAFSKSVYKATKQRQCFTESTRNILTDMHDLLNKGFNFKLLNVIRLSLGSFLQAQILIGIIIALIVVYHYLDDQILALSERLDSADSEDD